MSDHHHGQSGRRRIVRLRPKPETFPGPTSLARLSGRLTLAGYAVAVVVGVVTQVSDDPAGAALGGLVALAGGVPLFLLRPRFGLGYAAVATAGVVVLGNADSRAIVWFALLLLAAWCVLSEGVWIGVVYSAGAVAIFGSEWLWVFHDAGWAPWIAGLAVTVLAVLLIRHEFVLVERLRAAQADLAERTRSEERNRIARELHDVIAHSLTVALLHVTSARLAVEHDPADAARALDTAERLGRQALTEVRATMGPLRDGDAPAGIAPPVPGVSDVPTLVEQCRRAGVEVALAVEGDPEGLPETVGSTIYRIVQESLTNATKHAPGSAVSVRLDVTHIEVEVQVESGGQPGNGSGMGLVNMAERAAALGGTCTAGPGGRGWLVTATLPLRAERSPAR